MNKKKLLLGIIAIVCVVVLVVILCTSGNDTPDSATSSSTPIGNEQVDEDRTQLFVYNFNGGYGSDWLIAAKERFEAEHENDVWEEGKKGVQIIIDPKKEAIMDISSQILGRKPEVYFTEKAYLYTLRDMGVLADITDAVTTPLSEYGETESIADKMTDEQRAYWGIKEGEQVKYYGIPHYAGYFGLNYNVDLFNNQGYYFRPLLSGNYQVKVHAQGYNDTIININIDHNSTLEQDIYLSPSLTSLSLIDETSSEPIIYPNPCGDKIFLRDRKFFAYKILNSQRKKIIKQRENNLRQIDVSYLPAGVYFLTLFSEEGTQTLTFIKQ